MIHMTLDLKPEAKQRPRFNRTTGRAYTAEKTRKFENAVNALAKEHVSEPLNGAVSLSIVFVAPRLKAEPKSQAERKYKTSRPDLSNLIKSLEDGLEGALFNNDAQVVKLSAEKVYAGLGESPHIEITASVIPVLFSADESEQSRQSVQSSAEGGARMRESKPSGTDNRRAQKEARREQNRIEHRITQQRKYDEMRAEKKREEYERGKMKLRELIDGRAQEELEIQRIRQAEPKGYSVALLRRTRALKRRQSEGGG